MSVHCLIHYLFTYVCHGDRLNDGRHKIYEDNETHGETAETAKLVQEDELGQVVHRRVDPTPTLRQQNLPVIGGDGVRMCIPNELRLEVGEVLEQQGRQVSIFTEMEQVLHVQSVDTILRVVPDDLVTDEERLVRIGGTEAIQGETTGQTSD